MTAKAKQAKAGPEDEENEEEEESGADKGSEDDGGAGSDGGDLESHIRKVVREVVGTLVGPAPAGAKASPAQDEESVRRMVRDAQDSLKKEEAKESRFKEVAETVESLKKVTERPPARAGVGGKIQSWLWGEAS